MTFKCKFEGLVLKPSKVGDDELPNPVRLLLYLMGLLWIFLGVAIISDVFMNGIEKITSSKRRVTDKKTGRKYTVYVWNATVANLTLMALGSSAPEILLSLIEITGDEFFLGPLGVGTIVGSAAFNLLCISAVCVCAIPDGEVRYIKEMHVYMVTASCSVFAYLWLMLLVMGSTPDVCEIWEAIITLLFCPFLVLTAYIADRGYFKRGEDRYEEEGELANETISDDVSEEELKEIAIRIREEHGQNLTDEQVVKIMRAQYFHHGSRAQYRHMAMEVAIHGRQSQAVMQPRASVAEVLNTSDDIQQEKLDKTALIGFESVKYAYAENIGQAKVVVVRTGAETSKVYVKYITVEGTAKKGSDYDHVEGQLVFEAGETSKEILITIKDDTTFENDEAFTVRLSDASSSDASPCKLSNGHAECTVMIIDDDNPGELKFEKEEVFEDVCTVEKTVNVVVHRTKGANGKIACQWKTDNMTAVAGVDYQEGKGVVEFENGQQSATIPVKINASRGNNVAFNVVINEASGCKFDKTTDGGADSCICHVNIRTQADQKDMIQSMMDRVHSANAVMGHKNWAQQFHDALFQIGDDDEEEEGEEGEEPGEKPPPTKFDIFLHVISVPWKLLFAFVPPVDYCGGWACFCMALVMIAVVTALVGDMANLVSCCFDILPETGAITFVALGTSLPDTFASKTAATMDPYADASIGNITGSNSVNVFLGVGIAWCLASFRWQLDKPDAEWISRIRAPAYSTRELENVKDAMDRYGGNAVFVTRAGTIWFNLMVFSLNAFAAIQHLYARRRKWGGELGGPKKGFFGQYFSGGFLVCQWFLYLIASTIFARLSDPLTYGDLAKDA